MRIAINLLYLLPGNVGGTETYAAGLLHGISMMPTDYEFVVFVSREATDWPLPAKSNFKRVVCPINGANRAHRYFFEQFQLPFLLREHKISLVHSLGYVGPIMCPCPSIVTIPDLNYIDLAHTIPFHRRIPLRFFSTQAARVAKKIITISSFSKERLSQTLSLPRDKIVVTHLAPRHETLDSSTEDWSEIKQIYGINEPYLVAFGGGALHKNIDVLLRAFAILNQQLPINLVLIGHVPPDVDIAVTVKQQDIHGRVIPVGYVPGTHIRPLLSHADVFVLPSLYEGFGLPVLEAQQSGVAVACSKAGSLPEVAGDGAVFFDPESVDNMAETMIRCLYNSELRQSLHQRGLDNLKRFSWKKTAGETLAVYEKVLSGVAHKGSDSFFIEQD